jgi:cytochrome b561
MQIGNSPNNYGAGPKLIHWLTAALVVGAWAIGTFFDFIPKGPARQIAGLIHVSFGEVIALLLIARLIWRAVNPPPPPEQPSLLAKGMLIAIYALLLAVPLVGVAMVFSGGHPLRVFAILQIPSPLAENKPLHDTLKEAHEWLANGLVFLALLHAGAAFHQHFGLRNSTLRRMLPFARA